MAAKYYILKLFSSYLGFNPKIKFFFFNLCQMWVWVGGTEQNQAVGLGHWRLGLIWGNQVTGQRHGESNGTLDHRLIRESRRRPHFWHVHVFVLKRTWVPQHCGGTRSKWDKLLTWPTVLDRCIVLQVHCINQGPWLRLRKSWRRGAGPMVWRLEQGRRPRGMVLTRSYLGGTHYHQSRVTSSIPSLKFRLGLTIKTWGFLTSFSQNSRKAKRKSLWTWPPESLIFYDFQV